MPSTKRPIRKAVFPVAGLGTRFLPATKAMPKEMLTVVDRPVIQHVVDEARAAGIEHFIFVTGRNKGVIEDHFDSQYELEHTLQTRGKNKELAQLLHDLPGAGQTSFTRQQKPARPRSCRLVRSRDSLATNPLRCCSPTCCIRAANVLSCRNDRCLSANMAATTSRCQARA